MAAALAAGLRAGGVEADELPIADGGNGTMAALVRAHSAASCARRTVTGPARAPVEARWALLPGGTAVVEMAEASGLVLIPRRSATPGARRPRAARAS